MKRRVLIIPILCVFITQGRGLWPFSSRGRADICIAENSTMVQLCDCTEPNVICRQLNLTQLDFILPDDAEFVDFSRNSISTIKAGLPWPSASIVNLDLSYNVINDINEQAFVGFSSLEAINLSHNALRVVTSDVLKNLTNLNTLDLSFNHITNVDPDWFTPVNNLIRLNLANNPLGDEIWTEEAFSNLVWLEYLDLSNSSFGVLPIEIFHNNSRLKELRLAKNRIDQVPLTQLHYVRESLEYLDLTANHLRTIATYEFYKMHFLRTILINDMPQLLSIEAYAFHGLDSIEVIEAKNNPKLSDINPFAFFNVNKGQAIKVPYVDLSNNNLTTLNSDLLNWTTTEKMNLRGNPWSCDCQLSWLVTSGVTHDDYLTCNSPPAVKDRLIKDMTKEDFKCNKDLSMFDTGLNILLGTSITVFIFVIVGAAFMILRAQSRRQISSTTIMKRLAGANMDDEPSTQYVILNNYEES